MHPPGGQCVTAFATIGIGRIATDKGPRRTIGFAQQEASGSKPATAETSTASDERSLPLSAKAQVSRGHSGDAICLGIAGRGAAESGP